MAREIISYLRKLKWGFFSIFSGYDVCSQYLIFFWRIFYSNNINLRTHWKPILKAIYSFILMLTWRISNRKKYISRNLPSILPSIAWESNLCVTLKVKVKATQSCLTLCDPTDYTVQGILQAGILEWVAFPFSRGSSQPRDCTQVSCIAGRFFTSWATREAHIQKSGSNACAQLVEREEYLHFLAF